MNTDNREKNSIRNVSVGMVYQFISLVMNFLAKTFFIKILGPDYLAINGLFTNIFMLFSFAEFGISVAMNYSLYKPIANGDISKICGLYSLYQKFYRKMSLIILVVGVCVIPLIPYVVKLDNNIKGITMFYLVFLINIIVYNMFIFKTYLLIADQRKYIIFIAQIVTDIIGFSLQIFVLVAYRDYLTYLIILCVKTIGFSIASHFLVKKYYPFIGQKGYVEEEEKREIKKNIKDLFVYRFALVLVSSTDNVIISIIVGTIYVGYYSNYDLIVMGIASIVTVVYSALSSSIGNLIAEKDNESAYSIFKWVQVISMWLSGAMAICLMLLFQDFIKLWIGSNYLLSEAVIVVIVVNFYISCIRDSMKIFRETLGIFDKVKYMMISNAAINLILSFVLGYFCGIFGVLIATTISALLTFYWYEPILIYRAMKVKKVWEYFGIQGLSIILLLFNLFLTNLILNLFSFSGISGFLLKAVLCFIICNIIYFLVLGRTQAVRYVISVAGSFFIRKKKDL